MIPVTVRLVGSNFVIGSRGEGRHVSGHTLAACIVITPAGAIVRAMIWQYGHLNSQVFIGKAQETPGYFPLPTAFHNQGLYYFRVDSTTMAMTGIYSTPVSAADSVHVNMKAGFSSASGYDFFLYHTNNLPSDENIFHKYATGGVWRYGAKFSENVTTVHADIVEDGAALQYMFILYTNNNGGTPLLEFAKYDTLPNTSVGALLYSCTTNIVATTSFFHFTYFSGFIYISFVSTAGVTEIHRVDYTSGVLTHMYQLAVSTEVFFGTNNGVSFGYFVTGGTVISKFKFDIEGNPLKV